MARAQPVHVPAEGGLILGTNKFDALEAPGAATVLTNFEVPLKGGYRRINGYDYLGGPLAVQPSPGDKVLGVVPYAQGVVVVVGTGVFYSEDGFNWFQVNKDTGLTGVDDAGLSTAPELPRTQQGQAVFVVGRGLEDAVNNPNGVLYIATGGDSLASLEIEGSGAGRTWYYEEVNDAFPECTWIEEIDGHLAAVDSENEPNAIYLSALVSYSDFADTGSNKIELPAAIEGIKAFRNTLYIFTRESIHTLVDINNPEALRIEDVTKNMGCVNGHSIQEVGGDVVFLARDGVRRISATARIGDVNLDQVGKGVQPIMTEMISRINTINISSCVITRKNQYRLFYEDGVTFRGVCATLFPTEQGLTEFVWTELVGMDLTCVGVGVDSSGVERYYQGGLNGDVYLHDTGNSFAGDSIPYLWKTPDTHYGDLGTRKTLLYINVSFEAEGAMDLQVQPTFDFGSLQVVQPPAFEISSNTTSAVFGVAVFGADVFGSPRAPLSRNSLQGSGSSVSFSFGGQDTNPPFTIHGYHVEIIPSGRK